MSSQFGLTLEQYQLLDDLVIQPLKEMGAEVFLFGSRAQGKHHPFSDVDLLYRFSGKSEIPLHKLAIIREAIEDSRFPYLVDIVNQRDLPDSYRDSVLQTMVSL